MAALEHCSRKTDGEIRYILKKVMNPNNNIVLEFMTTAYYNFPQPKIGSKRDCRRDIIGIF